MVAKKTPRKRGKSKFGECQDSLEGWCDLALSSRAYACSVAAGNSSEPGIKQRLKLLPIAEPEVDFRN